MYKKTKFSLDGVVRHNTLSILFILFLLFTFIYLLQENEDNKSIILDSSKEDNSRVQADKYFTIVQTAYKKGDYDKSLKFYQKALDIYISTLGVNHSLTVTSYNNIGSAWESKGEYDKAIEFYNKALRIYIATLGENHPDTAMSFQ